MTEEAVRDKHSSRRQRAKSVLPAEQDDEMVSQARKNAYAELLNCLKSTGPLTPDMEVLMNDTAEALDIKVDMTSNHPRRLFSAASSAGASSASSTSSTAPKRRSPRKGDTTSRVGWGSSDLHNDLCEVCDMDGDLLCCDSCSLVFHLSCVRPCISTVPEGDWICAYCELDQERSPSQQGGSGGSCGRSTPEDAIRTMKMLHALIVSEREEEEARASYSHATALRKGPYELDKSLSIFKSDSRFIIKRRELGAGQSQRYVEVSRFWTLEEALFEVRRLSMEANALHNTACESAASTSSASPGVASSCSVATSAGVRAVDSLLHGWVLPSPGADAGARAGAGAGAAGCRALQGRLPVRRRARSEGGSAGLSAGGDDDDMDQASDLWCKACVDDPEVVCCGFCGCKHCFGKHDHECLVTCDMCEERYHTYCVDPILKAVPTDSWYCQHCHVSDDQNECDEHGEQGEHAERGPADETENSLDGETVGAVRPRASTTGERSSKRSRAGVGYNPHAFSNSQELPNVSKYLQHGQEELSEGAPSGRPPTGPASGSARGGRRRRGGRGRTGAAGRASKGQGGRRVAGARGSAGSAGGIFHDEAAADDLNGYYSLRDVAASHPQTSSFGQVDGYNVSAALLEGNNLDGLALGQEMNALLPVVVPGHLPMRLSRVMAVVDHLLGRSLLPKEAELMAQFRRWAPAQDRDLVAALLAKKKEDIMKRLLELDPSLDVQEVLTRPCPDIEPASKEIVSHDLSTSVPTFGDTSIAADGLTSQHNEVIAA